jgi:predicted HicB family RNase H-like nuclease
MYRATPTAEQKIVTQVRIPESLHERLTREADERCVSMNLLMVKSIEWFLENMPEMV